MRLPPARRGRTLSIALFALAALSLWLLTGGSCRRPPATSVLLISIDSLRTDRLHALGYPRETTPVLDGLSREGTLWTGVVAAAPWTTPSMMSVMSGLYPDVHHIEEDDGVLAREVETLAERFRKAGSATAAFVPSLTLRAPFGFSRGFDKFDERKYDHATVTSPEQASAVIHWLESTPGPFFAWVHFWDPHYNYNPPAPYDRLFMAGVPPPAGQIYDVLTLKNQKDALGPGPLEYEIGQYDGEIAFTDRYVGEILDSLRASHRLDSTLVVVCGDHGEAFQEHHWLTHTNTVYEEVVRVPVIARLPGRVPAGVRIADSRSLVDLHESLASWAGLPPGKSQSVPLSFGDAAARSPKSSGETPESGLVVSTTRRQASVLSARSGRWSLVLDYAACRGQLYDLDADPGQKHDLANEAPGVAVDMKAKLKRWIETGRREHPVPIVKLEEADPEVFERLRALGYGDHGRDLFGDTLGTRSNQDPLRCLP